MIEAAGFPLHLESLKCDMSAPVLTATFSYWHFLLQILLLLHWSLNGPEGLGSCDRSYSLLLSLMAVSVFWTPCCPIHSHCGHK